MEEVKRDMGEGDRIFLQYGPPAFHQGDLIKEGRTSNGRYTHNKSIN